MQSSTFQHSLFSRHFAFMLPAVVNFVGAGGKTGLILTLMHEHAEAHSVIYTTTTRIHPPPLADGLAIIASESASFLQMLVNNAGLRLRDQKCRLVIALPAKVPGYLRGVDPDFAITIDRVLFPFILNEADGARGMSLKFPRDGEPVLMQGAEYLVPVIGLDCMNQPLGPETVFRWPLAAERLGLHAGDPLTPELGAEILFHSEGVCKGWKPGTKIVAFINKVETAAQDPLAWSLARAILQNRNFPVERVVWGSLHAKRADSLSAPTQ